MSGLEGAIYAIGFQVFDTNFLIGTGFSAHYADVIWTNAHVRSRRSTMLLRY